jgi:hypothetical protein
LHAKAPYLETLPDKKKKSVKKGQDEAGIYETALKPTAIITGKGGTGCGGREFKSIC